MTVSLKIAQVAPVWTRVPPDTYGGAELMVYWLTEELVRMGHQVTLFASGDSVTSAKLQSCCDRNVIDMMARSEAYTYNSYAASNMTECLRRSGDFDIVHCHMGAATIPYSSLSQAPVIHTVHEGLDSPDEHWVIGKYPDIPIAPISHSQISTVPESLRKNMNVIYHGCDLGSYAAADTDAGYLAFIGRMSQNKNPRDAIATAKALNMPIRMVGAPQTESERRYFKEFIKPQIDNEQVIHLGSVGQPEKIEFLRNAAAVLFPIQWEEHFGLVMIEAMACGVPVVAFKRGSVPEVIDTGITGYYCEEAGELPELVKQALLLDRKRIRQQAECRFSISRMTDDYVDLYHKIIGASKQVRYQAGRALG